MQCGIIRKRSPGRFIPHNFMGFFNELDHWKLGENLGIASWDSYPLGFTEQFAVSVEEHVTWTATAHPDFAAFHHDLYRGVTGVASGFRWRQAPLRRLADLLRRRDWLLAMSIALRPGN